MQLYGRTDLVAVYYIPEVAAAYAVWTGSVAPEEARAALVLTERMIRERRITRLIMNCEESRVPPAETPLIVAAWMGGLLRRGVRAWANIPPKSAVAALANKPLTAALDDGVQYAAVPDLAAAKRWLATT